jgi:16S rRNA (uracil1498-N3)-methyltransferase
MPLFFIQQSDVSEGAVHVGRPLLHHLTHVLRYRSGDLVTLVDETGKKYSTRIATVSLQSVSLDILSEETQQGPPKPLLWLGVALTKGTRIDWVIEKAVELGVMRISPLITRRVVVKPRDSRTDHQHKRWGEIAKEAAQQSERWEIPRMDPPMTLDAFLEQTQSSDFKFIFWEKESSEASLHKQFGPVQGEGQTRSAPTGVSLLIGPEGGWEQEEVDRAGEMGYISVSLGDRPLRADTAAITALSIIQYEWDRLNRKGLR